MHQRTCVALIVAFILASTLTVHANAPSGTKPSSAKTPAPKPSDAKTADAKADKPAVAKTADAKTADAKTADTKTAEAEVVPENSDVIVLTDEDFEKRTQATSGSTTGPWFIEVYAPWCGHCKKLAPDWENLATDLKGLVNVAKVDGTVHTVTARRFGVQGFPLLFLLNSGKLYEYGGERSFALMKKFALGGFTETEVEKIKDIPKPLTKTEQLMMDLSDVFKAAQAIVTRHPMVCLLIFMAGLLVGYLVSVVLFFIMDKKFGLKSDKTPASTTPTTNVPPHVPPPLTTTTTPKSAQSPSKMKSPKDGKDGGAAKKKSQ